MATYVFTMVACSDVKKHRFGFNRHAIALPCSVLNPSTRFVAHKCRVRLPGEHVARGSLRPELHMGTAMARVKVILELASRS